MIKITKIIFEWIRLNPNRTMFLVPIVLVAAISISHVVSWYDIANPINWAIYLSIAIEVGAMTALVAATNKIKGGVWFMFGLVTVVQMIGNIFYSYKEIDSNGELFKSWVELTAPIWEMLGTDINDTIGMKRWLAFLEGGLLPIISLTSLHFFTKYESMNNTKELDSDVEDNDKPSLIVENSQEEETILEDNIHEQLKEIDENNNVIITESSETKIVNEEQINNHTENIEDIIAQTRNEKNNIQEPTTTTTTTTNEIKRVKYVK